MTEQIIYLFSPFWMDAVKWVSTEHVNHVELMHVGLPIDERADAVRHFFGGFGLQGEKLHVLGEVICEREDVLEPCGSFLQRPDQIHPHHIEGFLDLDGLKLRCLCLHFFLPLAGIASANLHKKNGLRYSEFQLISKHIMKRCWSAV